MAESHLLIRAFTKGLRPYWRLTRGLTRGLTLGAQGAVIDARSRILLVRHGYRPGWFLPGGGVERYETAETALARELEEEAGIVLTGPVALHGLFANFERFPGDRISVYTARAWRQPKVPRRTAEIAEQGFFAPDALPEDTNAGTRRRLDEIFNGAPLSGTW